MSVQHPGSVSINKVNFENLAFLTDQIASQITNQDFDLETGKPLSNLTSAEVDAFYLDIVRESMSERKSVMDSFVFKYPKVLELDNLRDIQIAGETAIDIVFVTEGASMKNMFGYYFWTEEDGLLDGQSSDGYYYRPTVIFPHVLSDKNDSTTLQQGDSRHLRGNLPNGNFGNINVGFFLVPHGWFAFINNVSIGDDAILYSTLRFNEKYFNSQHQMVNDRIYSVYVKSQVSSTEEMLFLGFEDIFYGQVDDLDYNDCVVGLNIADISVIVDFDKYASLIEDDEEPISKSGNSILTYDEHGEYVEMSQLQEDVYTFKRHFVFKNNSDRDTLKLIFDSLHKRYFVETQTFENNNLFILVAHYRIRPHDIRQTTNQQKTKIYLYMPEFDQDQRESVELYQHSMQKFLQDPNYNEYYEMYKHNNPSVKVINNQQIYDRPCIVKSTSDLKILGNGIMTCKKGSAHLPFKNTQWFQIYFQMNQSFTKGLFVNIKMDHHPDLYLQGKKTFVRFVSFVVDNLNHVIVDLGDLNIYTQDLQGNLTSATEFGPNIKVSAVLEGADHIKKLISVFRNDSGAIYRTVTIKDSLTFYCIRFPNIKNNPTMVFLDDELNLDWLDNLYITSGTYFIKQKVYPVATALTFQS
jgi:hypothetical protein